MSLHDAIMAIEPPGLTARSSDRYDHGFLDGRRAAAHVAKSHDAELAELRRVTIQLYRACRSAIVAIKGRGHDQFLWDAIAAAEAAGVK
jgi:hypothetical protein